MTKREFCELMAAGHEQAAAIMEAQGDQANETDTDVASLCWITAAGQEALARAFRDLAKGQPND